MQFYLLCVKLKNNSIQNQSTLMEEDKKKTVSLVFHNVSYLSHLTLMSGQALQAVMRPCSPESPVRTHISEIRRAAVVCSQSQPVNRQKQGMHPGLLAPNSKILTLKQQPSWLLCAYGLFQSDALSEATGAKGQEPQLAPKRVSSPDRRTTSPCPEKQTEQQQWPSRTGQRAWHFTTALWSEKWNLHLTHRTWCQVLVPRLSPGISSKFMLSPLAHYSNSLPNYFFSVSSSNTSSTLPSQCQPTPNS